MKLRDYMKANGLSDADIADALGGGVTKKAVSKWKYGETVPRLPEAVRLEEVTGGLVTARDFVVDAPSASDQEAAA